MAPRSLSFVRDRFLLFFFSSLRSLCFDLFFVFCFPRKSATTTHHSHVRFAADFSAETKQFAAAKHLLLLLLLLGRLLHRRPHVQDLVLSLAQLRLAHHLAVHELASLDAVHARAACPPNSHRRAAREQANESCFSALLAV